MNQSILIVGCGWLGNHFLTKYHLLFETIITTSKTSIAPAHSSQHFHMDIFHDSIPQLPKTDICLISIPFSKTLTDPSTYTKAIKKIIDSITTKKMIFTSSTSVYKPSNTWVNEKSKIDTTPRAKALFEAENHALSQSNNSYILRIAGICGYSRNSIKKCKQPKIQNSNTPVNLVHTDDILQTIHACIETKNASDIINVVATEHPTRKRYYQYICNRFKLPHPIFENKTSPYKKVCNKKLRDRYLDKLIYPSPLGFEFSND